METGEESHERDPLVGPPAEGAAGEHLAVAAARIVSHHPVQAPELTAGACRDLDGMGPPIVHGEVVDFRRAAPRLHLQKGERIDLREQAVAGGDSEAADVTNSLKARFALPAASRRYSSWAIGRPPSVSGTGRAPS